MFEEWVDAEDSSEALLESVADEGIEALDGEDMLDGFIDRTPMLTPFERAELLGTLLETKRSSGGSRSRGRTNRGGGKSRGGRSHRGGSNRGRGQTNRGGGNRGGGGFLSGNAGQVFNNVTGGLQSLMNLTNTVVQAAAPNSRFARDFGQATGVVNVGTGVLRGVGGMFGAPQQGQVPALPGRPAAPQPGRSPAPQQAGGAQAQQLLRQLQMQQLRQQQLRQQQAGTTAQRPGTPTAPTGTPAAGGQLNATALLGLLLSNRGGLQQVLQRALQQAPVTGSAARREVVVEVPSNAGGYESTRSVSIPLGAVMNTIASLATQSMVELNANTHESDPEIPEYLLGEDGQFIVDPANPDQRAALVLHYLRAARHAEYDGDTDDDESEDWGLFDSFEEDVDAWDDDFAF